MTELHFEAIYESQKRETAEMVNLRILRGLLRGQIAMHLR